MVSKPDLPQPTGSITLDFAVSIGFGKVFLDGAEAFTLWYPKTSVV